MKFYVGDKVTVTMPDWNIDGLHATVIGHDKDKVIIRGDTSKLKYLVMRSELRKGTHPHTEGHTRIKGRTLEAYHNDRWVYLGDVFFDHGKRKYMTMLAKPYDKETDSDAEVVGEYDVELDAMTTLWNHRFTQLQRIDSL